MFGKITSFEFRYQIKHPVFWIAVILFGLMSFFSVASDNIRIGSTANVHKNASFVIAQTHLIFGVMYMFVSTAFVASVVLRDDETGFAPIIRTTRIRKFDYLIGRFIGAYGAAALSFLAVPLGMMAGAAMPWVDAETLGAFAPGPYLFAYFFIGLPILFTSSAIFFALATATRSLVWTYIGVITLMVLFNVFKIVISKQGLEGIAALWDPFGTSAFGLATRYWSAAERNTLVPVIGGYLLWNRLLWLAISMAILTATYALFRFEVGAARVKGRQQARLAAASNDAAQPSPPSGPLPHPRFNGATARAQLFARTQLDLGQVFKSPAYFVLLGLAAVLSIVNLWTATEISLYGGRVFPVSRIMMEALNNSFTFVTLIIAIFYAGELVWRERDRRTHEIIGATAVPDWAFLFPKVAAIVLVLISTLAVGALVAMLVQAVKGYSNFEIGKYLLWYLLPQSIDVVLLAILAVFIQALSSHKFVGWGVMVLYIIGSGVMSNLGFEHGLYTYGYSYGAPLSDMNGQGRFWKAAYWFRLYWAAFALILLIVANAVWPRGADASLWPRLRRLPRRLAGMAGAALAVLLLTFAATGTFIFINTNVWNPYRTALDEDAWMADREKALWRFHDAPQPQIIDVKLDVDIRPHGPGVLTRGSYVLENRTGAPLREVHVRYPQDLRMISLSIGGGRPKTTYQGFHYRIFALDTPMQPGERRTMAFTTAFSERGFRNSPGLRPPGSQDLQPLGLKVLDNGAFLNDRDIAPSLGFGVDDLLRDPGKRRKYGLPAERRPAKLGTPGADRFSAIGRDGGFVNADIRITTDADQTPMAPGYKVSDVVSGGRRTARFHSEAPIMRFFSIQSARYAVKSTPWKGVQISVYYDPQHPWNVDRITRAVERSLDYDQANFSPYQFRQVRVLEFPAFQGEFAQSFANTIPWSEGLVFISDNRDPTRIDMVSYVGAHEVAHQWWGHQLIGADEQGASMLSETLAQYSALMVMKHTYGPDMMRKFLRYELDSYLKARGGEAVEELPLDRVEDQGYIHYRKGSLVMYRLQDEIGEAQVNSALRKLLRDFAFKGAPYPTTLDFLRDIRAVTPADKQGLITDLFERITLYDIKTTSAVTRRRADGRYQTTLNVSARKLYANGQGKETASPLNETLDVGVFTAEPGKAGFGPFSVLSVQRLPIRSGVQSITLVSDRAPAWAGVDPYNKLVDRNADDNGVKVDRR